MIPTGRLDLFDLWKETLLEETFLPAREEAVAELVAILRSASPTNDAVSETAAIVDDVWACLESAAFEPDRALQFVLTGQLATLPDSRRRNGLLERVAAQPDVSHDLFVLAARELGETRTVSNPELDERWRQARWWQNRRKSLIGSTLLAQWRRHRVRFAAYVAADTRTRATRRGNLLVESATLTWEVDENQVVRFSTDFLPLAEEMILVRCADAGSEQGTWNLVPLWNVESDGALWRFSGAARWTGEPMAAVCLSAAALIDDDIPFVEDARGQSRLLEPGARTFWSEWSESSLLPALIEPEAARRTGKAREGLASRWSRLIRTWHECVLPRPRATVHFAGTPMATTMETRDGLSVLLRPLGERFLRMAVELPEREPGDLVVVQIWSEPDTESDELREGLIWEQVCALRDGSFPELIVDVPRTVLRDVERENVPILRLFCLESPTSWSADDVEALTRSFQSDSRNAEARLAWVKWAERQSLTADIVGEPLSHLLRVILNRRP